MALLAAMVSLLMVEIVFSTEFILC